MGKDFKRIESTVSTVVGKPLTWVLYLGWLFICWLIAEAAKIAAWLRRQRLAFGK